MTDVGIFGECVESWIDSVRLLDWYDGPLSGIARASGSRVYYFDAVAWDAAYEMRLYALRPIDGELANEFESALEAASAARHGRGGTPGAVDDEAPEALRVRSLEEHLRTTAKPVAFLVLGEDVQGMVRVMERMTGSTALFEAADRSTQVEDLARFIDSALQPASRARPESP